MKQVIEILKNGNICIMPSDTIYGIFGDATNLNTIKRIDDAKHSNKPHLVLVSSIDMLSKCVVKINELQKEIINKYWPGPLTILFQKSDYLSDELTKGSPLIAIRMPKDEFLLDIINEVCKPLISTSANITNESVITSVNDISYELKSSVDYIYDGGTINNEASTLIKVEDNKITFLREGILSDTIKKDFEKYI